MAIISIILAIYCFYKTSQKSQFLFLLYFNNILFLLLKIVYYPQLILQYSKCIYQRIICTIRNNRFNIREYPIWRYRGNIYGSVDFATIFSIILSTHSVQRFLKSHLFLEHVRDIWNEFQVRGSRFTMHSDALNIPCPSKDDALSCGVRFPPSTPFSLHSSLLTMGYLLRMYVYIHTFKPRETSLPLVQCSSLIMSIVDYRYHWILNRSFLTDKLLLLTLYCCLSIFYLLLFN